jgi:two-component system chemotaxis response regulator CheB
LKEFRVSAITIIVAGGNPAMRMKLVKAMEGRPGLRVIGQASDLPATYTAAEAMEPDLVLVARELTLLPEFSLMRSLFRALDARWITVDHRGLGTGSVQGGEMAGDFAPIDTSQPAESICAHILATMHNPGLKQIAPVVSAPLRSTGAVGHSGKLILIGASTGGVDALLTVLSALPKDCPPIAVVQHTGQGFSESLIRLLDRRCAVSVVSAQDGMELKQGHVVVAAGCPGHMRIKSSKPWRVSVEPGPHVSGHLPSVDALFKSAVSSANSVVAALLTGMGRDGAEGLLALRKGGAITIGQDESSSVVYGMPRAAWEIGAVRQQLPLGDIAAAILKACAQGNEEGRIAS